MPFVIPKDDEELFLRYQAGLPDRVVGILFPVLIDRRLETAIKGRWRDLTPHRAVFKELFRDGGPLGSFQPRIHIGYAIGLYDEAMHADIKRIARIRNAFAHEPGVNSFADQPVGDLTGALTLPERYPIGHPADGDPHRFAEGMMAESGIDDTETPIGRFLRSVELVLTWLALQTGELAPKP